MTDYELISLLKRNNIYIPDSAWLSYFDNHLSNNYAVPLKNSLVDVKPRIIHDVWSAYLYGDTVKIVYTKVRANPKPKSKIIPLADDDDKKSRALPCERFLSSISRARQRVFELASCNEFHYFCTFTLNAKLKDRDNLGEFRKSLTMLFRNINRSRDDEHKIKYLLIPEQHKKGGWHIHGLLSGLSTDDLTEFKLSDNIPQKLKNTIKNGEKVYNFSRYADKFGFFTATKIKDKNACSVYLTKYITKDLGITLLSKKQHLFFASQGLKGREVLAKNCSELPPFNDWDFENDYVMIKTIRLSENTDSKI